MVASLGREVHTAFSMPVYGWPRSDARLRYRFELEPIDPGLRVRAAHVVA